MAAAKERESARRREGEMRDIGRERASGKSGRTTRTQRFSNALHEDMWRIGECP